MIGILRYAASLFYTLLPMKKSIVNSRREFLKTAATGAAGAVLASSTIARAFNLQKTTAAWRAGLKINPAIDNFKVVSCYDEGMVINKIAGDFARQNESVDTTLIEKNMDGMAVQLTLRSTAATAWSTIFQRPASKQWNQVIVAIKVNCSNVLNMPRVAVVNKLCIELIALGVLPRNITIYDSCANAWGTGKYTDADGNPVAGLDSGVIVSNTDATTDAGPVVPIGSETLICSSVVAQKNADDSISYLPDIIINCAVNKGHLDEYGGFTMTMKNHIGTIKFDCPSAQELIDINQSEAIIGQGTSGIPCRQQLCIIDSLWASTTGPTDANDKYPCRIIMGTLAPVVDYLTAEKVRKDVMNVTYNTTVVDTWLSAFGYAPSDPEWIELTPSTGISLKGFSSATESTTIRVSLSNNLSRPKVVTLTAPFRFKPLSIKLFDLRGRIVRDIILPARTENVIDLNDDGVFPHRQLPTGTYTLKCSMGSWVKSVLLTHQE